jgi:sporulation protein YlmC with PRC-barrel domain
MRAAQLLGTEVRDRSGRSLGEVHDIRMVREGPVIGEGGASFQVHSLVVGAVALGSRLGLGRTDVRGPWPLKVLMAWLHDDLVSVHWSEIRSIEEDVIRMRSVVPKGTHHAGAEHGHPPGEIVDAALQLLDRQIVDVNGELAGKVDDLELTFADEPGRPPYASAILTGPGALSHRIGGRLGRWIDDAHRRLSEDARPPSISFGVVKRIDNHLELSVPRRDLGTMRFDDWTREKIVGRIPGN